MTSTGITASTRSRSMQGENIVWDLSYKNARTLRCILIQCDPLNFTCPWTCVFFFSCDCNGRGTSCDTGSIPYVCTCGGWDLQPGLQVGTHSLLSYPTCVPVGGETYSQGSRWVNILWSHIAMCVPVGAETYSQGSRWAHILWSHTLCVYLWGSSPILGKISQVGTYSH